MIFTESQWATYYLFYLRILSAEKSRMNANIECWQMSADPNNRDANTINYRASQQPNLLFQWQFISTLKEIRKSTAGEVLGSQAGMQEVNLEKYIALLWLRSDSLVQVAIADQLPFLLQAEPTQSLPFPPFGTQRMCLQLQNQKTISYTIHYML